MANEYWLSDAKSAVLKPLIPTNRPAVKPGNNWQVISGILHVLKFGCRWRGLPGGPWPTHHHLQSAQQLVEGRRKLAGHVNRLIPMVNPQTQSSRHHHQQGDTAVQAGGNRTVSVAHTTPI